MQRRNHGNRMLLLSLLCMLMVNTRGNAQGVLFFGKSFEFRSNQGLNQANMPAQNNISAQTFTSPRPLYWQKPLAGNLYASPNSTGGIAPYTLLSGEVLDNYNPNTQVIYEAPPHPFLIQPIDAGGTTVVTGYPEKNSTRNPLHFYPAYGGPRISITLAGGVPNIVLGIPNVVVFNVPPGLAAVWLRVDFGTEVILAGQGPGQIFTVQLPGPVTALTVTYPAKYPSETVRIEAFATQGVFTDRTPSSLTGPGIACTSSGASGVGSFGVQRLTASLTAAVTADRTVVISGGRVRFTYTATNTSAIELRNVELTVTSFQKITIGTLLPGTSSGVTLEKEEVFNDITERAIASGSDVFNNPVTSSQAEFSVRVINPVLRCSLWSDVSEIKPGKDFALNAQADNTGDVKLLGVTITINPVGSRGVGDLEVSQTGSVQQTRQISTTTTFSATATASDEVIGSVVSSEPVEVTITVVQPAIQVELSADQTTKKVGKEVFYSGLVRNIGETDLTNVIVVDNTGRQVATISMLAKGAVQGFTFSRILQQTTTTTVTATGSDPWNDPVSNSASITVTAIQPALLLELTVDKTEAAKDEDITMTLVVTNTGDCELASVEIAVFGAGTGNASCGRLAAGAGTTSSTTFRIAQNTNVSAQASGVDPENGVCLSNTARQTIVYKKGLLESFIFPEFDAREKQIEDLLQEFKFHGSNFMTLLDALEKEKADPSKDGQLLAELAAAKANVAAAQALLAEMSGMLKAKQDLISTAVGQVASGINPQKLPDYMLRLVACNSKVKEMADGVKAMEALLNENKLAAFSISGKVVQDGKPSPQAQVNAGAIGTVTDGGGNFTLANLQGKKGEGFTLTAFKNQLSGGASVTYEGSDVGNVVIAIAQQDAAAGSAGLDDAIANLQGDDKDLCNPETIANIKGVIENGISTSPSIYAKFIAFFEKMQNEIQDQNANPCGNTMVAFCLAGGENQAALHAGLTENVRLAGTEIIKRIDVCPAVGELQDAVANLAEIERRDQEIQAKLGLMHASLQPFGCDQDKMVEDGQRIADNGEDPEFVQDGGIGQEIPGDGIDNNANGLQDEFTTGGAEGNVNIFVFDSGSLKDDVFSLTVSGQGDLGVTPAGGGRTYGLSLPSGTYTAIVTVITAPDNVGTFTIVVKQGNETLASASGSPPQGGRSSVTFTVK